MGWKSLTVLAFLLACFDTAPAGFFDKKATPRVDTEYRRWMNTLRNAPNPRDRANAADALKDYDPFEVPEIVPALMEAAQRDSSTKVRRAATRGLERLHVALAKASSLSPETNEEDNFLRGGPENRAIRVMSNITASRESKSLASSPAQVSADPPATLVEAVRRASAAAAAKRPPPKPVGQVLLLGLPIVAESGESGRGVPSELILTSPKSP